jgi:hypothetical protein
MLRGIQYPKHYVILGINYILMKQKLILGIAALAVTFQSFSQTPGKMEKTGQVLLPNGWK